MKSTFDYTGDKYTNVYEVMTQNIGSECKSTELEPYLIGYLFTNPNDDKVCLGTDSKCEPNFLYSIFARSRIFIEDTRKLL